MCATLEDLFTYAPKFVGQKAYCEQVRAWYTAVYSPNSRKLLWVRCSKN